MAFFSSIFLTLISNKPDINIARRKRLPDYSSVGAAALLIGACSGGGDGGPSTITPTNTAPSLSAPASITISENMLGVIAQATASDADGNALTFSVADSPDQFSFSIDGSSGEISIRAPLDFETPTDADSDNVYDIVISVDDGQASAQVDMSITVENVPNEGITLIRGAAAGDGIGASFSKAPNVSGTSGDFFIGSLNVSFNVPLRETVAYLIFGSSLQSETSRILDLSALSEEEGAEFFVSNRANLSSSIPTPLVAGLAPPPVAAIGAFNLIVHDADTDNDGVADEGAMTAIFPSSLSQENIQNAGGRIDLNASPAFPGLRSTRDNLGPTSLGGEILIGDLNRDTVSDVIASGFNIQRNNNGVTEEIRSEDFLVISGRSLLFGAQGLFDIPAVESGTAAVLSISSNGLLIPFDASGDVTGDGADDLLIHFVSGDERKVIIASGAALFADADGFVIFEELTAPERLELTSSRLSFLNQQGSFGDFDGDGQSDVLFSGPVSSGPTAAFVIYHEALANAPDPEIIFEDLPDNQKTLINMPRSGFIPSAINIGDVNGGGADDIFISSQGRRGESAPSQAYILFGEEIDKQSGETVSVVQSRDSGNAVRIVAPDQTEPSNLVSDTFGAAASRISDFDGDGVEELVIGASFSGPGGDTPFDDPFGAVYVIPSNRIINAAETGIPITLGNEF